MTKHWTKKMISVGLATAIVTSTFVLTPTFNVSAASTPQAVQVEGNVFLGNTRMEVGVNEFGTFGSTVVAPEGFNPISSYKGYIGMTSSDINGEWGNIDDYFLPGWVDEGFSITWDENGSSKETMVQSEKVGAASASGSDYSDNSTTAITDGDTISAYTQAKVGDDKQIDYNQTVTFTGNSAVAKVTVELTNEGTNVVEDLQYVRAFDPDHSGCFTTSNYYNQTEDGTLWAIADINKSNSGEKTLDAYLSEVEAAFMFMVEPDPENYTAAVTYQSVGWLSAASVKDVTPEPSSSKYYGKAYVEDMGIGLRFYVGDLAVGETKTITYYMSLESNVSAALDEMNPGTLAKQPESLVALKATDTTSTITVDLNELFASDSTFSKDTTITTEWYSYDLETNTSTKIEGAGGTTTSYMNPSLTVSTSEVGKDYYYCVITPNGGESVTSGLVRLNVVENMDDVLTVTFDSNTTEFTTSVPNDQMFVLGDNLLPLVEPEREGYVFTGWYSDAECTKEFDVTADITENSKVYCGWEAGVYGVINVVESPITFDASVPESYRVPSIAVIPEGLAEAIYGSGKVLDDIDLSLSIKQLESSAYKLVFDIKPMISVNGKDATVVSNDDIKSPVTFRIYLNSSFGNTTADVDHVKEDGSIEAYNDIKVQQDDEGNKYIELTVSEFSNFIVYENRTELDVPDTSDASNILLWTAFAITSLGVVMIATKKRKGTVN